MLPGDPLVHLHLRVPLANGRDLSIVHACGRVLSSEVRDGDMQLEVELPESIARQLQDFVPADVELTSTTRKSRV